MPALVTTLTVPLPCRPFCAFCELVSTLNSCSASGNGSGRLRPSSTLLCMAPSSKYDTANGWPPVIAIPRLVVMLRLVGGPVSAAAPAITTSVTALRPSSGRASTCSLSTIPPIAGIARLNERSRRFDRHRFLHVAKLHRDRDHRVAVDLQHDSGLRKGAEAREHRLEAVRSERQIQQHIRTRFIGHRFATETGLSLYCADGNARKNAATRIDHSSVDLGGSLSPPVGGTQEQDHNNADERARNAIHSNPPQLTSQGLGLDIFQS